MADIPVNASDAVTIVAVTVNGQVNFDYDFRADFVGDLKAEYRPASGAPVTILVGGTDFTASGLGTAGGGTISLLSFVTTAGDSVAIYRDITVERGTDYTRDLFSEDINSEQDRIFMIVQEIIRDMALAIKMPLGFTGNNQLEPDDGKMIGWDGNDLVNLDPAQFVDLALAGTVVQEITSRAAMTSFLAVINKVIRHDMDDWVLRAGNFTAHVAADPLKAVFNPSAFFPVSVACWCRRPQKEVLDVRWFGAVANSTGVGLGTDSGAALNAASVLSVFLGWNIDLGEGSYRSTGKWTYDRTTLNSNFGRVPSIIGAGTAMTAIFFDAGVDGLEVIGSTAAGVFGSFITIEGFRMWTSGKTKTGLKIKDAAFLKVEGVRVRGFSDGVLLQNVISSRFEQIFDDGNVKGVRAENGPSAIPCNAVTFENCWISGNDALGYDLENVATFSIIGGSVEGNGLVTFGSSPNTSGGVRAVNSGQGGHVGVNIDGVYFEHNAGIADVLIFSDSVASGARWQCAHNIVNNTFNRIHATEFTTNPVRISVSNVPTTVRIIGNGFGNLGTSAYVEDASRKYWAVTDTNNVVTIDESGNRYSNDVARPDPSNTYVKGQFLEAEATGYIDGATGSLLSGSKNVASVTKTATGTYQIFLRRPWAGRKACVCIPDSRGIPETLTIDNNSVTVRFSDTNNTIVDRSFNFVVFKPFY